MAEPLSFGPNTIYYVDEHEPRNISPAKMATRLTLLFFVTQFLVFATYYPFSPSESACQHRYYLVVASFISGIVFITFICMFMIQSEWMIDAMDTYEGRIRNRGFWKCVRRVAMVVFILGCIATLSFGICGAWTIPCAIPAYHA